MDFHEVVETTHTCRRFRTDPVPDAALRRVLRAGQCAPSGGNRQPVRFVVVRDAEARRRLRELYVPLWEAYMARASAAAARAASAAAASPAGTAPPGPSRRLVERADHFARHLDEVPVLLVVCAVLGDVLPTDAHLGRLSIVGGASVYPSVQNVLLAARAEGLGSALTTLLCAVEPEVKTLLAIPDGVATAATVALGWPAERFPARLGRRPLDEVAFGDRFGAPLGG